MTDVPRAKSSSLVRRRVIANGEFQLDDGADFSKTVENAIIILKTIALLGPISLGDISAELEFSRTVTHRILVTLMRQCVVLKIDNTYVVGPAVIKIGESVLPAFRRIIMPALRRLSAQAQETVSCAIRDGDSSVIVAQVLDDSHGLHVREELGARYPLHLGAHGQALMAALDDAVREEYYSKRLVAKEAKTAIRAAQQDGYAYSCGELRVGVSGLAATGNFQDMLFSFGVIMPSVRADDIRQHLPPLLEAVSSIVEAVQ